MGLTLFGAGKFQIPREIKFDAVVAKKLPSSLLH